MLRLGHRVMLTEQRLAKAEDFFARRGALVVAVARFIDGLRQANGIVAELVGMKWWRFLAFKALGAALWVSVWTLAGYFAGNHIDTIVAEFGRYERYVLIALGVLVVALITRVVDPTPPQPSSGW